MATVFLARDLKHDRPVALKVLHPELSALLGHDRFLREIRIAAGLQHPHILTLIDSGEINAPAGTGPDLLYYVMPFVDGESLRSRLSRQGRVEAGDAVRILRDALDALAHAHQHGLVHRDIKPENIMLTGRHALVVDFGVARAAAGASDTAAGATLTTVGFAIGTPAYMAPEQAAGQSGIDGRADLYALGVVGYELLTGAPPFTGPTPQAVLAAQISRTPAPLGTLRPDLAPALTEAIMRCLEKDPDQRWPSADALLCVLESFGGSGSGGVTAVTPAAVVGPRRRIGFAAAALLVVVALGAWAWTGPLRRARERSWVHEQAIPRLLALADTGNWERAYALARQVEAVLPGDSLFGALRPRFAIRYHIHTTPAGAEVWRKGYDAPDSGWVLLGRTPLDSALAALSGAGGGLLDANRLRIRLAGFRTLDLVGLRLGDRVIPLDRDSAIPREMVRVFGGTLEVQYPGFERVEPLALGDYLMDRFEVTNREFRRFVDSGG